MTSLLKNTQMNIRTITPNKGATIKQLALILIHSVIKETTMAIFMVLK
jgi:hypothetical protein